MISNECIVADRDLGTAHHTANELRITEVNSISEETLFTDFG